MAITAAAIITMVPAIIIIIIAMMDLAVRIRPSGSGTCTTGWMSFTSIDVSVPPAR